MNNNMLFIQRVYNRLLADVCSISGVSLDAPSEITYDWAYIDGPKLDKQLLRYIEGDEIVLDYPEWLAPLFEVFLKKEDPIVLRCIRQLLTFCYKTEQQPNDRQLEEAIVAFQDTEEGCDCWTASFASNHQYDHTHAAARRIVGSICYRINWSEITPSHGPGGVFPSRRPVDKSRFTTLYASIIEKYPYDQYYCALPNYWVDTMVKNRTGPLQELDCIVAKLVAVPKDSRGPRLICVHPTEAIWIQQGQRRLLERSIKSHPLTKGKISFTDQTVNGKLALQSSITKEFCTLDLKEASDRISCTLVRSLFGDYTYGQISCARATHVLMPDGRAVPLRKWAPMGNALCFPVESLIFFSLVVAGIRSQYGVNCTEVFVFGDDIIFPTRYHSGVIRVLAANGLVPNASKTFHRGFFRESCGVDAYKGVDVTPLRLRRDNVITLDCLVSICDLALRARLHGYEQCASFLYKEVRRRLREAGIYMPISNSPTCGGFYEYQNIPYAELILREPTLFYHKAWQRTVVRRMAVTGQQLVVRTGEWYHLQDSLLRLERKFRFAEDQCTGSDRPTEYAVPYRTRLQYGWADCVVT